MRIFSHIASGKNSGPIVAPWVEGKNKVSDESQTLPNWICFFSLFLVAVVSRIPQLVSPTLLLDGDECILGLMAKHTAEGKELPLFFYGQKYGLSLVEALAGACSFQIFGVGAVPLKLAMLALWMVGIAFYFAALSAIIGDRKSLWITLVLILMPAWAVWSMKARGGYITSFAATGAMIFLLVTHEERSQRATWFIIGLLTALVCFAQPLWLPGVLPIIALSLIRRRNILGGISWISGAAIMAVLVWVIARNADESWRPSIIGRPLGRDAFSELAKKIYINFTGSHFLFYQIQPGTATKVAAGVWYVLLLAGFLFQVYRISRKRYSYWPGLFCVSVVATLAFTLILKPGYGPRYLLPMNGLLVLWLGTDISDPVNWKGRWRKCCLVGLGLLIGLGTISMTEFKKFTPFPQPLSAQRNEEERIEALISYLKASGIQYTFSVGAGLEWQIMFYSKESIISRWFSDTDRYPKYPREVDEALAQGKKTALIGDYANLASLTMRPEQVIRIGEGYEMLANPDQRLLRDLGFQFSGDKR